MIQKKAAPKKNESIYFNNNNFFKFKHKPKLVFYFIKIKKH